MGAFHESDSLGTIFRDFRCGAKGAQQAESHVPVQLIVLDDKDTAAGEEQRHGVAGAGGVFGVGLHGIMPQDPERGIEQLGRVEGLDQDLVDLGLCRGIHHIVAAIGRGQDITGFLARQVFSPQMTDCFYPVHLRHAPVRENKIEMGAAPDQLDCRRAVIDAFDHEGHRFQHLANGVVCRCIVFNDKDFTAPEITARPPAGRNGTVSSIARR